MKVVINRCHGGFDLSPKAILLGYERRCPWVKATPVGEWFPEDAKLTIALNDWREFLETGSGGVFMQVFSPDEKFVLTDDCFSYRHRADPTLVAIIEELGDAASTSLSALKVVEIPDDVLWEIEEYDGLEWIAEKHRTWA